MSEAEQQLGTQSTSAVHWVPRAAEQPQPAAILFCSSFIVTGDTKGGRKQRPDICAGTFTFILTSVRATHNRFVPKSRRTEHTHHTHTQSHPGDRFWALSSLTKYSTLDYITIPVICSWSVKMKNATGGGSWRDGSVVKSTG